MKKYNSIRVIKRAQMRVLIFLTFISFLSGGCATTKPISYEENLRQMGLEGVKTDLSFMNEKKIESYFNECIANDKIFFYTGGYANIPLVDEEDIGYASTCKTVSVGCTGGVPEATQFNKLMLNHVRQNKIEPARTTN